MADTFYSIHVNDDAPVYVSEVAKSATNADFRAFDLNMCGPLVSRMDCFTVKLWARPSITEEEYILLIEVHLSLQSLQFLGKSLDTFHHPLPANSVLFHFPDGIYSSLTDLPPSSSSLATMVVPWPEERHAVPTSSYDALMRLANLDECIQDALITREKLEAQINTILEDNQQGLGVGSLASQAQESLTHTRQVTGQAQRQLRASCRRKEELLASLRARRQGMERGRHVDAQVQRELPEARMKLVSQEKQVSQTIMEDRRGQIRRISEDLLAIYPIESIPDKPLSFTIAGVALPNSSHLAANDLDRDAVAAALGYTTHLVCLLSGYLSMPMPYQLTPFLSNSSVYDPISFLLPQRVYPLHPVNAYYRFEYGVFLLNKDIEFLLSRQGLRIIDLRHTLPNLKYLTYLLTTVTGDGRGGGGGIRGLLPMRPTSSSLSRRGSEDSGSVNGESLFPTTTRLLGSSPPTTSTGAVALGREQPPTPKAKAKEPALSAASPLSLHV